MDFCGFERIDFAFQGKEAMLVLPNKENEKKDSVSFFDISGDF